MEGVGNFAIGQVPENLGKFSRNCWYNAYKVKIIWKFWENFFIFCSILDKYEIFYRNGLGIKKLGKLFCYKMLNQNKTLTHPRKEATNFIRNLKNPLK